MPMLRKEDRIQNLYNTLKQSDNKNLKRMTYKDATELTTIYDSLIFDFCVDAHYHGFNGISLGKAGQIKLSIRKPFKHKHVQTGEFITSGHSALYYFKPSAKLKEESNKALQERLRSEEAGGLYWDGE